MAFVNIYSTFCDVGFCGGGGGGGGGGNKDI